MERYETGQRLSKELTPVFVPLFCQPLIDWFWELHSGRQFAAFGPCPISFQEILAYQALRGIELSAFAVSIVKMLDVLYLNAYGEAQKQMRGEPEERDAR